MKNITFILLLIFNVNTFAQNLVINGSAENAPITNNWSIVSGNWTQRSNNPTAQDGTSYFFAGANSFAEMYQDIDLSSNSTTIDLGNQFYTFSCFLRSFNQNPADASKAIVTFRDNTGNILDTYDTGFSTNQVQWVSYSDSRLAPVGTRSVRITLISDRNSGTNNDGYIDTVVFEEGNTLSLNTFDKIKSVSIYPNPSTGKIFCNKAIEKIEVYDITGKLVFKKNDITKSEAINLSLVKGIYMIKLIDIESSKIIKHLVY